MFAKFKKWKRVRANKKILNRAIKTALGFCKASIHDCFEKKEIIGLTTWTWIVPSNTRFGTYEIKLDRLIRGDLIAVGFVRAGLTSFSEPDFVLEFGDQSHAFSGLLGLCDDVWATLDYSVLEDLTVSINDEINRRKKK